MPELPDDLYARIHSLVVFTFPHRDQPEQAGAKDSLRSALNGGDARRLPTALSQYISAYGRNAQGKVIPLHKNRPTMLARDLLREVEQWLDDQARRRAA
jgi:hypothetical protein